MDARPCLRIDPWDVGGYSLLIIINAQEVLSMRIIICYFNPQ